MDGIPFLYINIIALCCYALIFTAFIASKKTPAIWSFICVLIGFMLWTGGSVLMRLQVSPGVDFWYYVSVLALFSLAFLIYLFVCAFTNRKGYFMKIVWGVSTLAVLVLEAKGVFIAPPQVVTENGATVFTYAMKWPVAIPFVYFLLMVVSIAAVFKDYIKKKGVRSPGIIAILAGCLAVTLGNLLQIIPNNTFPWDTLSGILFALFLIYALYRKHMFRLTLAVSRSVVLIVSAAICVAAEINFFSPLENWITKAFPTVGDNARAIVLVLFAVVLSIVYYVIRKMMDALYSREEKQNLLLKQFSDKVSGSLNTQEILNVMINVIQQEINAEKVYICLPDEKGAFQARCCSSSLCALNFAFTADSPILRYLTGGESMLLMEEFENSPYALSLWNEERELLRSLSVRCIVPMRKEGHIVGLILLSNKERSGKLSYLELDFIETMAAVSSIAVENAQLYEKMFREARTDSLTGVWNYTYFIECLYKEFDRCGEKALSLLYIDLDDFKLYNQLYGSKDGDWVLCRVADILKSCVGENGIAFRCGGKVFAMLLPEYDAHSANKVAVEIQRRIGNINSGSERSNYKPITVSVGICASPFAASSAKELMDNADLAVYTAKNRGKGTVNIFHGGSSRSVGLADSAHEIVEFTRSRHGGEMDASLSTIYALTAAIDAKDHYTYSHSQNVARYSSILALAAGLSEEQVAMIYEAGLLHDIGKISIPETILRKTGSLSNDEYEIMKTHVNNSIDMIRHLPNMDYLVPYAVGHHERWDGFGYPRGLAGENIPVPSRCLAIADAFDAMTTDRPYRKGLSVEFATAQIEAGAGTQFDPNIAMLFVKLVRNGDICVTKQ